MDHNSRKKKCVGVIGAGVISQQVHLPVLLNTPGVFVGWVADISKSRAESVAGAYGLQGLGVEDGVLLPAADVVLLAVPPGSRERYYQEYAARGTAVLAEKPFATSVAEHDRVTALFPAHRLGCGYQRRFYGNVRLLKTVVQEQWFGPLISIRVEEGDRTARTGSERSYIDVLALSGGGVLASLGCHALDAMFYFTGADEYEVAERSLIMDGNIDRKVSAVLRLQQKGWSRPCRVDYTVSWLDAQSNSMTLEFERTTVRCPVKPGLTIEARGLANPLEWTTLSRTARAAGTSYQAFFLEWTDFLESLDRELPSTISAVSSRLTASCIEELYKERGAG